MTATPIRQIEAGGHLLRVTERPGAPDRTPLLLVNGIGAGFESFDPFVAALDPAVPVIRFDPPGAGGSPVPALPYRLPGLARSMLALLDTLGHETVDVLGISWGGGLAQQFARTAGGRCRRLVLVATGTGSVMVPAGPCVLARMATPRRYADEGYLERIGPDIYGGTVRADPTVATRLLHRHVGAGSWQGYLYQLLAAAGWTSIPFLPLLRQPTLVLTGDDDPIIPAVNGRIITALVPNARLHVYEGGHLELVAAPDRLLPEIENFLTTPHKEDVR